MKIEGLVISKSPYKERDIIANLLLRNGRTLSVYFYGGRGGGKRNKGSILEVGHMLSVYLDKGKKHLDHPMSTAKEWSLLWDSKYIRSDINAFYFMCFMFELIKKIGVTATGNDLEHDTDEFSGMFNVVSNTLFYMDKSLEQKQFSVHDHMLIFFVKFIWQLGVLPGHEDCHFCGVDLDERQYLFDRSEGSFACLDCMTQKDQHFSSIKDFGDLLRESTFIRASMKKAAITPFKEWMSFAGSNKSVSRTLFHYSCMQFNFKPDDFKSSAFLL